MGRVKVKKNFGGYPAWGLMYSDANTLLSDYNVDMNIVNQIILACINNGLSLNQTAVILGNAFLESKFNLKASNNIAGGHHGIWQFSTDLYNRFGLSDWNKQLKYFMEEVARTPDTYKYKKTKRGGYQMYMPHAGGNGWSATHKMKWDESDDINILSLAFGEGWERYGNQKADTDSRTQLAVLFLNYLMSGSYGFRGQASPSNSSLAENLRNNGEPTARTLLYTEPENSLTLQSNLSGLSYEDRPISYGTDVSYSIQTDQDLVQDMSEGYDISNDVVSDEEADDSDISYINRSNFNTSNNRGGSQIINSNSNVKFVDYRKAFYDYLRSKRNYQLGGSIFNTDTNKYNIFNIRNSNQISLPSEAIDYRGIIAEIFKSESDPTSIFSRMFDEYKNKSITTVARNGRKLPRKYYDGGYYDDIYNPSVEPSNTFTYKRDSWKKLWEGIQKFFKDNTNYEPELYVFDLKSKSSTPDPTSVTPAVLNNNNLVKPKKVSLGRYDGNDDIYGDDDFYSKKKVTT